MCGIVMLPTPSAEAGSASSPISGRWSSYTSLPIRPSVDAIIASRLTNSASRSRAVSHEIAGVPREEINLEISPLKVKISGSREGGPLEADARYLLAEMPRGHFERNVTLSVPIDMENVRAVYRDGILEIRLAKRPLDRVHKINVHGS